MTVRRTIAAVAIAAAVAGGSQLDAQVASTRPDLAGLREVVAAERAFSKLSIDRGMKAAFLANMSDSGVIFRPTAINARASWNARERPGRPAGAEAQGVRALYAYLQARYPA